MFPNLQIFPMTCVSNVLIFIESMEGSLIFRFKLLSLGCLPGKNFACIAEVIMQAMENERKNHVGSIDLYHLRNNRKMGEEVWIYFE